MSPDPHTRVGTAKLGIGSFGSFNTETLKFETQGFRFPSPTFRFRDASRCPMTARAVPGAVPGRGQLAAYDTRGRKKMIGIYDLPDRAMCALLHHVGSENARSYGSLRPMADAIYRFDPTTKSFGVLPLPRGGAPSCEA